MRAAKILAAVTVAILMGTTPSSSWNAPSAKVQTGRICQSALSLLGSSAGIVLVSENRCSP
jgi:hypothetical protein